MSRPGGRPPIEAVIFDFDGVIADTERLHFGAFQDVFRTRQWQIDEAAYFGRYLGYDDRGLVLAYGHDHGLSLDSATVDAVVAEKANAFSRHLSSNAVLFPSASACVTNLAREYPLAIASGALHREIDAILRVAGLRTLFRAIVGADDVRESKPAPEPYLEAARALGVDPGACLAIEDSAGGLAAAVAAGMRTVAITTTSPRPVLSAAERIIDRLEDFSPDLVRRLGGGESL